MSNKKGGEGWEKRKGKTERKGKRQKGKRKKRKRRKRGKWRGVKKEERE